jgi:hypothetical protein
MASQLLRKCHHTVPSQLPLQLTLVLLQSGCIELSTFICRFVPHFGSLSDSICCSSSWRHWPAEPVRQSFQQAAAGSRTVTASATKPAQLAPQHQC